MTAAPFLGSLAATATAPAAGAMRHLPRETARLVLVGFAL